MNPELSKLIISEKKGKTVPKISRLILTLLIVTLILGLKFCAAPGKIFASDFNPNELISDSRFTDVSTMNEAAIQQFLSSKQGHLADYTENGKTATRIIWEAANGVTSSGFDESDSLAKSVRINPQVLLVTLQKEQSLIEGTFSGNDLQNRLDQAMGCRISRSDYETKYKGFTNQVNCAAWVLTRHFEASVIPGTWLENRKVNMDFTTNDNRTVNLSNQATAALYAYTPWVYDGNYNFWVIFNRYFGDPNNVTDTTNIRKLGDANGDNTTDSTDLSILADQWSKNVTADTGADFNKDGVVDSTDLSILADAWGK